MHNAYALGSTHSPLEEDSSNEDNEEVGKTVLVVVMDGAFALPFPVVPSVPCLLWLFPVVPLTSWWLTLAEES